MDQRDDAKNRLPMERVLYEVKKVIVGQDHLLERLIVALLAVQVTVCMYTEKDWKKQVNCAIVLIPLILRALMIK